MFEPVVHFPWAERLAEADLADWVTVAAYGVAGFGAFIATRMAGKDDKVRERAFWLLTACLLVFFAVNEVFDFQTLITDIGKITAKRDGWYEGRHVYQVWFIAALAIAGVAIGALTLWLTRTMHCTVHLAIGGLGSIALFILARAISFHKMEQWFAQNLPIFNYGTAQELVGIAIVGFAAALYAQRRRN